MLRWLRGRLWRLWRGRHEEIVLVDEHVPRPDTEEVREWNSRDGHTAVHDGKRFREAHEFGPVGPGYATVGDPADAAVLTAASPTTMVDGRPECFGNYGFGTAALPQKAEGQYCEPRVGCPHGHECWQELRCRVEERDPRMIAFNAELTRLRTEMDMDSHEAVLALKNSNWDMPLEEAFKANLEAGRTVAA